MYNTGGYGICTVQVGYSSVGGQKQDNVAQTSVPPIFVKLSAGLTLRIPLHSTTDCTACSVCASIARSYSDRKRMWPAAADAVLITKGIVDLLKGRSSVEA
jgi:hypothetical protein